jgi:hypothetical protein
LPFKFNLQRYNAIDELKATVPIWKKEFFEGGDVWWGLRKLNPVDP